MSQPPQPHALLERKEMLEGRIGLALAEVAPAGWDLLDLRASMTVETAQLGIVALLKDGREAALPRLPDDVHQRIMETMAELRRLLYRPDQGTWFSMRLGARPETYAVAYDDYFEPPWEPPLGPENYLRDFEAFPRDLAHIPGWLLPKLRQARPGHFTGNFSVSGRMSAEDQHEWAARASALLAMSLPPGNHQATMYCNVMGHHVDMDVSVLNLQMREVPWRPPAEFTGMLHELRKGMYQQGAGTWFGARVQVHDMARISVDLDFENEPKWSVRPPESAYREELELFPRPPERIPRWLARYAGLAGGPVLDVARPYDATLPLPGFPHGYPTFNDRPDLSDDEAERLAEYLENAPLVLTHDGSDPDLFDQSDTTEIPREFRTDGAWVWPASVTYYLVEHNVAPPRGLVEHARSRDFQVPELDQGVRDAAAAAIGGAG